MLEIRASDGKMTGTRMETLTAREEPVPGAVPASLQLSVATFLPTVLVALLAGMWLGRRYAHASSAPPAFAASDTNSDNLLTREGATVFDTRFCPVCFGEYLAGTSACDDCAVELVDEYDMPEFDPPIHEVPIRVGRVRGPVDAMLLRQHLAAHRIPSFLNRSSLWDIFESDVYVFESDALRAKRIIREFAVLQESSIA